MLLRDLGFQEIADEALRFVLALERRDQRLVVGASHPVELEAAHHVEDFGSLHLVRDAIKDAIAVLKQPQDIEEPWEREARESLDIDHDRKGVSGTPDLAPTILEKITKAAVFVGDVTLVGEIPSSDDGTKKKGKKLINSNVAIEYGFALSALSYNRVLIVQNIHFGDREELPFDLRVKAGPIQFNVSPSTPKDEIARVRHQL